MPRTERNKKAAEKSLAKAAAQSGQSNLTSLFSRTSNLEVSTYNEEIRKKTHARVINDDFETLLTEETWVKITCEFTDKDRTNSEKNGRFFLAEWFEKHDWLAYHWEKRRFARHALQTVTRRGEYSTLNMEKDLIHGRKPLKNLRSTKIASLTKNACAATASGNVAKRSIAATLTSQILEQQELYGDKGYFRIFAP